VVKLGWEKGEQNMPELLVLGVNAFKRLRERIVWSDIIKQVTVAIAATSIVRVARPFTESAYNLIEPYLSLIGLQIVLACGTFTIGCVLYFFRCRSRGYYGFCECVLGVYGAISVAGQIAPDKLPVSMPGNIIVFISWVAALYVIVRGLDNIYEALKKRRLKRESLGKPGGSGIALWERIFFGIKGVPEVGVASKVVRPF
jgi:hypothetical protein